MNRDSKRKVRNLSKRVHETGAKRSWSRPWVNHLYFSLSLLLPDHVLSDSYQLSWVCFNGVLGGELEKYVDIHGRITIKVVVPSCQKNDDENRNIILFEDDKVLDLLLFFFSLSDGCCHLLSTTLSAHFLKENHSITFLWSYCITEIIPLFC